MLTLTFVVVLAILVLIGLFGSILGEHGSTWRARLIGGLPVVTAVGLFTCLLSAFLFLCCWAAFAPNNWYMARLALLTGLAGFGFAVAYSGSKRCFLLMIAEAFVAILGAVMFLAAAPLFAYGHRTETAAIWMIRIGVVCIAIPVLIRGVMEWNRRRRQPPPPHSSPTTEPHSSADSTVFTDIANSAFEATEFHPGAEGLTIGRLVISKLKMSMVLQSPICLTGDESDAECWRILDLYFKLIWKEKAIPALGFEEPEDDSELATLLVEIGSRLGPFSAWIELRDTHGFEVWPPETEENILARLEQIREDDKEEEDEDEEDEDEG